MKNFICALVFTFILGCSVFGEKEKKYDISYPKELQEINRLVVEKKTDDAKIQVNKYINKAQNIHWYGHAYFLKAFIYEVEDNNEKAIRFYREAVQHSVNYDSTVEAKALYNLSFVYEKANKIEEMTSTLLDLMKRRNFFDILTGNVEMPARLAAAYIHQGKKKEALIFHREAANNFNELVRNGRFKADPSEISKSLFYLGFLVYPKKKDSFKNLSFNLHTGQKYLLGSIEASKSSWSEKASRQLNDTYDWAWQMITEYEPEGFDKDPLAKKRQKHGRQLEMASDIYDLAQELRVEEFPLSNVNQRSNAIMKNTDAWIERIENFAQNLELGPATVRSKPVRQRKLMKVISKPRPKVRINKEAVTPAKVKKDPNL